LPAHTATGGTTLLEQLGALGLAATCVDEDGAITAANDAFLLLTGVKMLLFIHHEFNIANNPVLRFLKKHLRVTDKPHGHRFWVRLPAPESSGGPPSTAPGAALVWWATPLFLALVLIEVVDLVFAVDSVPAIFALTNEPLIVFTSNIFAILGLRSMYFMLAGAVEKFHLLKFGLATVLVFVGLKMVWLNDAFGGKFPITYSLGFILFAIAASIVASLLFPKTQSHSEDLV